jgi:hypothetical protein
LRTDGQRQNGTRQADVLHDGALDIVAAAEQGIQDGEQRQAYRADAERAQNQYRNQNRQKDDGGERPPTCFRCHLQFIPPISAA